MEARQQPASTMYDAVIIGGGPAGLTAALYLARAKYKVVVVEKEKIGGQITITSDVVNYPGVARTSGAALTETMHEQAKAFGAEFLLAEAQSLELKKDVKVIHTSKGDIQALSVILALGANPRTIGFDGEQAFRGRGVAYCATCDGEFFTGMDVFVIGGGFAAVEESMFLTKYARTVTILVRKDHFACAQTIVDELQKYPKISVRFNTEIVSAQGDQLLSKATFKNNKTGETWQYTAPEGGSFGIFVFAGYVPNTALFAHDVALNDQGYVITDANHKTNLDGVYAAGDICIKNLRQVVTAVSDGAIAATAAEKHIAAMHEKLSLPEFSRPAVDEAEVGPAPQEAPKGAAPAAAADDAFISADIREKLVPIFAKFAKPVIIKVWLSDSPLSKELLGFSQEMAGLTDKILVQEERTSGGDPGLELLHADGSSSGIWFHGVPGGHEFNSFIIALYNVAGPGQEMDDTVQKQVAAINTEGKDVHVKVVVSLSCTMCPEVVMGTQRLAAASPHVTAEMYDVQHFPELRRKYNIMSVPCMIVNDSKVYFGKKDIHEIASLLQ